MVHPDSVGTHHYHRRKRIHQGHEEYPHPDAIKRVMDKMIYFVGVAGPIMTLPQLFKIWVEKNAAGISVISWITYLVLGIFWLSYGIMHKEKPIIVNYILWITKVQFV